MEGCYRYHDMMLDALLQLAGKDTTVVLVSDHGYISSDKRPTPEEAERLPEASHRFYGIAALNGPAIKQGEILYGATLLDVTPTILRLFGLPVGGDMEGRAWAETFRVPQKVARIPTWEMMPGDDGMHARVVQEDPELAAAALLRLIDLGYMSPPTEGMDQRLAEVLQLGKWNLAYAYIDGGLFKKAIPLLEELTAGYADVVLYQVQLVECYIRVRDVENARRRLDAMDGRWQDHPHILLLRGALSLSEGKTEEALELLEDALQKPPSSTQIFNLIGKAYGQLQDFTKAAAAYEKTLAMDSEDPSGHDGLAQASIGLKDFDRALDHALKAVGYLHYFPSAHFHLGVALAHLGHNEEAISAFETCLGMAVNKKQVHVWLAKLYDQDARDQEKTLEHRRQIRKLDQTPRFFFLDE